MSKSAVYVGPGLCSGAKHIDLDISYGQTGQVTETVRVPGKFTRVKFWPDGSSRPAGFWLERKDVYIQGQDRPQINPRYGKRKRNPLPKTSHV
jgi:hypothetical protein